MIRDLLASAGVALAAAATLRGDVRAGKHRWNPDSYDYAIRMLRLRGVPLAEAADQARAMLTRESWLTRDPRFAHAYQGLPEWWALFAPRVGYSALAALLYGRRGFAALTDVAGASYVASAVVLYRFLRRFGDPAIAAALAAWYVRDPAVRDVGLHAMSDSTALVLWIAALDAMVALNRGGGPSAWARFAALTGALSFTRPLPYLPLASGVALAVSGAAAGDRARLRTGAGIAAISLGCAAAVGVVLARAGVPSTREHMERVRAAQPGGVDGGRLDQLIARLRIGDEPSHSLGRWYATTVGITVATALKHAVTAVVPVIAVGGLARRDHRDAPLLLGALAGGVVGCIADPDPRSTRRTIVLPLYPVFAAGCCLALARPRGAR